ncbi:hypothetical protein C900_02217 [Fulvivirga imtechensis AK7]|uniref:Outer membrane protein beta-barrel domain-containing protein n=1 Tax=Fulvivirga imtechensis AK7 TaxID=1237149 RepID=L8JX97_9BACT|nr:hypothetical protein [Fulvivirga imtechensis]ELR71842.1 hypothetical protein C900_02217 [Fulvivirga imtechensis AK7]
MKTIKFGYISLLFLLSCCLQAQDTLRQDSLSIQHKYSYYLFTINPVRAAVDEVSINWEFLDENLSGHGVSLGYIYPNRILYELPIEVLDDTEDLQIRASSYGGVGKYYKVIPLKTKKPRFLQVVGQLRYYYAQNSLYVIGNYLSDGALDVVIDRHIVAYGGQVRYGGNDIGTKGFVYSFYAGLGVNIYHNIYTHYDYYLYRGEKFNHVPSQYHLKSDGDITGAFTLHLGIRLGFAVRR